MTAFKEPSRREFLAGSIAAGAAGLGSRLIAADTRPSEPEVKREETWQIGCYTRPWGGHEYRIALDAIAEAGFKYVGLMTAKSPTNLILSSATTPDEAARVGEEVKKRGLKVANVYAGDFFSTEPDAAVRALRRMIDASAIVGSPGLMLGGSGDPKHNDDYYRTVAACCDYAAQKNIGLSIKPHGGLNATGPQCRRAIEFVGHRNFRLWYDPGNIYYYSEGRLDPVDDAAMVDGLVVGMSVKDYLHPKNVDVTPGTGKVDFAAVMARLKKGGFTRGPLIVETLARGDLPTLLSEAKKARRFVEDLTAGRIAATRP
ncbi:MAG TPA: sugar phosphate isomerase/epimerase family protein [Phycisphaerae bacterium]|nr:sugar phosphate isomerase/epimerase family protein [Phycisphaerae bacterium]HRR85824.1 sugar phosphate isomerase/epimerase family protein [Phycisphaerae bacterium]